MIKHLTGGLNQFFRFLLFVDNMKNCVFGYLFVALNPLRFLIEYKFQLKIKTESKTWSKITKARSVKYFWKK